LPRWRFLNPTFLGGNDLGERKPPRNGNKNGIKPIGLAKYKLNTPGRKSFGPSPLPQIVAETAFREPTFLGGNDLGERGPPRNGNKNGIKPIGLAKYKLNTPEVGSRLVRPLSPKKLTVVRLSIQEKSAPVNFLGERVRGPLSPKSLPRRRF
jgi:hypothetical protein